MAKQVDSTNIGTLLEALITKVKSFFWRKEETDNTPTSGSNNLVKSGGVYSSLQGIRQLKVLNLGGFLPSNGTQTLGTKSEAAAALNITEAQLDSLFSGEYDYVEFSMYGGFKTQVIAPILSGYMCMNMNAHYVMMPFILGFFRGLDEDADVYSYSFDSIGIKDVTVGGESVVTDATGGVAVIPAIPDVSQFITRSVNDLANYYLKSETYTKDEVASLIGAIQQTVSGLAAVARSGSYNDLLNKPNIPPADYVAMVDITSSTDGSGNVEQSAAIVSGTFAEIDAALLAQKTVLLIERNPDSTPVSYRYFRSGEHVPGSSVYFASIGGDMIPGAVSVAVWYHGDSAGPERVEMYDGTGIMDALPMGDGNAVTSIERHNLFPILIANKDKTFVDTAEQALTDAQKSQARTNIGAGTYSKPIGGIPASDIATGVIPAAPVNADWNANSGLAQILNKPTIPAAPVNADWNATEGLAKILNKPSIPAAQVPSDWDATEGVSRILNKPTVPTQYAGSPTAGGFANKSVAIPFGSVDADSTDTAIKATVDNFPTELTDGVCAYIRNNVVASASGFTLNINGTGAKPVYQTLADASRVSTVFNANSTYLFIYNSTRVEGGCWDLYYGYNSNDNTIGYNLRTDKMSLPTTSACYRYRLLFTSADGEHFVPANASSSTNATAKRTTTQTKIDPFGSIRYYSYTAAVSSGARPSVDYLWEQYAVTLGYSFNRTGAALTLTAWKPVYIKCTPQADGSAIIDAETPYVQELPTTADGEIYIYLGVATSATTVEMTLYHPVYYHDGTRVTNWPGPVIGDIQTALDAIIGEN